MGGSRHGRPYGSKCTCRMRKLQLKYDDSGGIRHNFWFWDDDNDSGVEHKRFVDIDGFRRSQDSGVGYRG